MLRKHNACRPFVRSLFESRIVRGSYYLHTEEGILEFKVIYNCDSCEEIDTNVFTTIINNDMVRDGIITNHYRLDCINAEDLEKSNIFRLTLRVIDNHFVAMYISKNQDLKERIYSLLRKIKAAVLEEEAMYNPQKDNLITIDGDNLTLLEELNFDCNFDGLYASQLQEYVEKLVNEWVVTEEFEMNGWKYVVEVEHGIGEIYVLRVFSKWY